MPSVARGLDCYHGTKPAFFSWWILELATMWGPFGKWRSQTSEYDVKYTSSDCMASNQLLQIDCDQVCFYWVHVMKVDSVRGLPWSNITLQPSFQHPLLCWVVWRCIWWQWGWDKLVWGLWLRMRMRKMVKKSWSATSRDSAISESRFCK